MAGGGGGRREGLSLRMRCYYEDRGDRVERVLVRQTRDSGFIELCTMEAGHRSTEAGHCMREGNDS